MNYLDTVKGKIADYIVREPVVETEEVISAYTLFSAVENCKKRLRHVGEIEKGLVDTLNTICPPKTRRVKKGLFKKTEEKYDRFSDASHIIKKDRTTLEIYGASHFHIEAKISKDYMYDDIYAEYGELSTEVYEEIKDDISNIFGEIDYFGSLYSNDDKATDSGIFNNIKCNGFNVGVSFVNDQFYTPYLSYSLKLNDIIDPNNHGAAHFYGKENDIQKVINENIVTILKNTPINISDLSYMFCMIVLDYRRITEKNKIDEEIDKAFQKLY